MTNGNHEQLQEIMNVDDSVDDVLHKEMTMEFSTLMKILCLLEPSLTVEPVILHPVYTMFEILSISICSLSPVM